MFNCILVGNGESVEEWRLYCKSMSAAEVRRMSNDTAIQELGIGVVNTCVNSEDPDLQLARILQEQERALWLLTYNNGDGSDYFDGDGEVEGETRVSDGGTVHQIDSREEGDIHYSSATYNETNVTEEGMRQVNRARIRSDSIQSSSGNLINETLEEDGDNCDDADIEGVVDDEALAMSLQRMEDRSAMAELIAAQMRMVSQIGGNDNDERDHDADVEDDPHSIDVNTMTYEQLSALGDIVGTASRGMTVEKMDKVLRECSYLDIKQEWKNDSSQENELARSENSKMIRHTSTLEEQCAVCREDYQDEDLVYVLPCGHFYHSSCIREWLKINRSCPICAKEVVKECEEIPRFQ